jgi:spermidine synthase
MALFNKMNWKPGSKSLIGLLFSNTDSNYLYSKQVSLFYIGFGSILSQILLVREFLVSFYGNELSIGIIFAWWLVWIGLGSAFGNVVVKQYRNVSRLFPIIIAVTPCITFAQVLAVKFVRAFLHTTTGEFLSMLDLLGFSFVVLSVGCLLWGLLFTLGAKSLTSDMDELWFGVNKAYVVESLGSVAGGLLFSFVFATWFSTLQIVFLLALIALCVVLWVLSSARKLLVMLSVVGMAILFAALLQPIQVLEYKINTYQWSFINDKLNFVRSMNTKYQNLSLLYLENQHTVYADGRPAYNIPNTYDAELLTHSIMIHRADAKRVLVLGGGFNGVLKEILKYPVQEVEYVEIDPALLPFVEPVANIQDRQALHDSRVHIAFMDGREFVRRKMSSFDVILMNIGEPSTASLNRFYTVEFFKQCYQSLNGNGIFAFSFPSSAEYLANELKDLNVSIYQTMKCVFTNILIVPGTHAVLIGTTSTKPLISQPDSLARSYIAAGISAEYFTQYTFEELMPLDQVKSITNTLETAQNVRMNTDNNPVTYYFDLLLWNKFLQENNLFSSFLRRFWIFVAGTMASGLAILFILLQRRRQEKQKQTALAVIISVCGMTGMALNLLFLLNFQEAFGSIYEMVGAMIAANMLGLALGAFAASRLVRKYEQIKLLLTVLTALVGLVLLLPELLNILLFVHFIPATLFVTLLSGGLMGMLFGIVNRFYLNDSSQIGSVYAFDVLGSSIGALTTCSVLLPVLGIQGVVYFLFLLLVPVVPAIIILRK